MSSYERDLESLRDQLILIVTAYEHKKSVKHLILHARDMLKDLSMLHFDKKEGAEDPYDDVDPGYEYDDNSNLKQED